MLERELLVYGVAEFCGLVFLVLMVIYHGIFREEGDS